MSLFQQTGSTTAIIGGLATLGTAFVSTLAIIVPIVSQRNSAVLKGWEGLGKGYQDTIAMKDKEIDALSKRLKAVEEIVGKLQQANARITELETQNTALNATAKTQADEIQVLKAQVAEIPALKTQNAAQETEIQTLRKQVAELQKGQTP